MSKIKIGLFGFGVVGQGIYQVVQKSKNAHAEIVKICVRDPEKPRKVEVDKSLDNHTSSPGTSALLRDAPGILNIGFTLNDALTMT